MPRKPAGTKARGIAPTPPDAERDRRVDALRRRLDASDLDGLVVYGSGAVNHDPIRYLANFVNVFPRAQSILVAPRRGSPILLVDREWNRPQAERMTWLSDVRVVPVDGRREFAALVATLETALADAGLASGRVGVFESSTPTIQMRALETAAADATFVDGSDVWADLVRTPTPHDVECVERAAELADAGLAAVVEAAAAGRSEREVAFHALETMAERGAEFVHGSPISTHVDVGAGSEGSSNLQPFLFTERRLESGEMFWVDLIASYEGYYVDCDRTVCVGTPSPEQRALFDVCAEMHEAMRTAIEPGVTGEELWRRGYDVAASAGYDDYLNAVYLGHTTGATISSSPTVEPGVTGELTAGQFLNVEPGLMHPEIGSACIETTHRVTDDGAEQVTQFDTGLHVV